MAERITTGLWPHSQPVRLFADRNGSDCASSRIDVVDDIVPPSRQPQLLAVGADIAHVWAAAAGDLPDTRDFISCQINDGDAAVAVRCAPRGMRAAVGNIESHAIAARIKPMGTDPGWDEINLFEAAGVDDIDAVGMHVGHVEATAVGRNANVLRHALLRKAQVAQDLAFDEVDLDQTAAAELARKDRIAAVDREIGVVDARTARRRNRLLQRHRLWVTKIEPLSPLGDDNR